MISSTMSRGIAETVAARVCAAFSAGNTTTTSGRAAPDTPLSGRSR